MMDSNDTSSPREIAMRALPMPTSKSFDLTRSLFFVSNSSISQFPVIHDASIPKGRASDAAKELCEIMLSTVFISESAINQYITLETEVCFGPYHIGELISCIQAV